MRRGTRSRLAAIGLGFALTAVLPGGATPARAQDVTFNHFDDADRPGYELSVDPGSFFVVEIQDTCVGEFRYEHLGVLRQEPEPVVPPRTAPGIQAADPDVKLRDFLAEKRACVVVQGQASKKVAVPHERKYSGYLIQIRPKAENTSSVAALRVSAKPNLDEEKKKSEWEAEWKTWQAASTPPQVKNLQSRTIVVSVDPKGWDWELAGGFSISALTDMKYAQVTRTVDQADPTTGAATPTQVNLIVEEPDKENDARLGLAGYIHMTHAKNPRWSGTFGLGIQDNANSVNYFVGLSRRLGGKAFVTGGVHWGPVDALPSGTRVSPDPLDAPGATVFPVTGDNLLNNLQTKTEAKLFLGVSYSFLNPGVDFFTNRFATADDTAGGDGGSGGGTTPPSQPPAPPQAPPAPTGPPAIHLALDPRKLDQIAVGTEADATLTVSNHGGGEIAVASVTSSDPAFTVAPADDKCTGQKIAAGKSCTVAVTFKPTAAGSATTTLTVGSDDPNHPTDTIQLEGVGAQP